MTLNESDVLDICIHPRQPCIASPPTISISHGGRRAMVAPHGHMSCIGTVRNVRLLGVAYSDSFQNWDDCERREGRGGCAGI